MTTVEKVKQCRTPQEALLVLAEAIDDLAATQQPTDPWEQPLTWGQDVAAPGRDDNRSSIVDGEVVVQPVSPERQRERAAFAVDSRLHEFYGSGLSLKDFHDAYVKGGPRWLYYTNRDAVMAMPESYRRELVADVLLDSPSEADEIGRDILKYDESVPQDSAIEGVRQMKRTHGTSGQA